MLKMLALWFAANALIFAWLAYGRYIDVSRSQEFREGDRLR